MTDQGGRCVLLRHGETEWSRSGRHTGTTDVAITDLGRRQAEALATLLASWHFVEVRVSPLRRARETAELAGLPTDLIDADLAEWDYGDYEGRTSLDIQQHDPEWTIFDGHTPGAESLAVAHGHLLRVLAARWLGRPGRFGAHLGLDAGSMSILHRAHDLPILQSWNRTPRLH